MKRWARYLIGALAGAAVGLGGAVWLVRNAALGNNVAIGPWATGRSFGSAGADPYTRAVVAVKGLLALPAQEARYYTAATDSDGAPLDGRCRYLILGGELPAAWWSMTAYDPAGYLIANPANRFSVASNAFQSSGRGGWSIRLAPTRQPGAWLPSGGVPRLELTLRTYLPTDGGAGNPSVDVLPRIMREGC